MKQSAKYQKVFQYCTQHRTIATTDGSGDTVEDAISIKKLFEITFQWVSDNQSNGN